MITIRQLKNLHIKPAKEKEQTREVTEEAKPKRVLNRILSESYMDALIKAEEED